MRFIIILSTLLAFAFSANAAPQRIISIGGAITEIIYDLGQQDKIVGSDTTSYYPEAAKDLPKIGYQRSLSVEGILSLKPDLIICTIDAGPPAVLKQLEQAGVKILKLQNDHTISGVINKITEIAKVLDVEKKSKSLIADINSQISELEKIKKTTSYNPKIMFILQHGGGSPMIAGRNTAADGIIKLSGATNAIAQYEGYKILTAEALVSFDPDIILATDQGLEQIGGKEAFSKIPGMALTKAAKDNNIIVMDSLLLLGFGPRTPKAAKMLLEGYLGVY